MDDKQDMLGSPLGQLDPSHITNMVVDGLGVSDGGGCSTPNVSASSFAVPDPPIQNWNSPAGSSRSFQQSPLKSEFQIKSEMSMDNPMTPNSGTPNSQGRVHTPFDMNYQQQGGMQMPQYPQQSPGMQQSVDGASPGPVMYRPQVMGGQAMPQQQMMPQQGGGQFYPQQQWPPQQQGPAHFMRQPQMMGPQQGQRVMIHRVPPGYPGYPGGPVQHMPQTPGGGGNSTPGTPTPMGSASGGGPMPPGPPGAPRMPPNPQQVRTAYPPGASAAPPPYPYAAGMGGPPSGGQPVYPQGHPNAAAFQQQQMRAAGAPVMRPYMSPGGMGNPPHQMFPASAQGAQQPHTPQTPQPPYTPNGSRFAASTQSPHYPAANGGDTLRSPPLMSPSMQPMPPQAAIARAMSGQDLLNQQMRMSVPQQPIVPPTYYTQEPSVLPTVTPELCLSGCVIQMCDVDRLLVDKFDYNQLAMAVRLHGGDLEVSMKNYPERMSAVTHVILESARPLPHFFVQFLKDRKRIVTMQWLCDVLVKRQLEPPYRLAHLPSPVVSERLLLNKTFSLSGFDESERAAIKYMIEVLSGRMVPFLSRETSYLIAKGGTTATEKVERAREWNIPVVNYQWIAELYAGIQREPPESPRYQLTNMMGNDVTVTPFALECMTETTRNCMNPWKIPIPVTADMIRLNTENRRTIENDEAIFPNTKFAQLSIPTEKELTDAEAEHRKKGRGPIVTAAFVGFTKEVEEALSKKIQCLGGVVTDEVASCTHLVSINGRRTERLLEAIALGKNIVGPSWIETGYNCKQFMDTLDFFMRDEEQEKALSYSCRRSVLRARYRPVFEDITFYISPFAQPSREMLMKLVTVAGGKVDDERPEPAKLARCVETDEPYIVIASEGELRTLQYLLDANFPIYTSELVLMSVLRSELHADQLQNYRIPFKTHPPPQPPNARPPLPPAAQSQILPPQPRGTPPQAGPPQAMHPMPSNAVMHMQGTPGGTMPLMHPGPPGPPHMMQQGHPMMGQGPMMMPQGGQGVPMPHGIPQSPVVQIKQEIQIKQEPRF